MTYGDRTALIVVDVQNDFADPDGSLFVSGAHDAIDVINEEVRRARDAGSLIVYTQDWHPPSTPHFEKDGGVWPVHCVQGTWGAEFHPELLVVDEAEKVRKGTEGEDGYSAFSMRDPQDPRAVTSTGLRDVLEERGIERVVVVGLATDYCVKETALDAARLGFGTTVLRDAVRAVDLDPGDGEAAMSAMVASGVEIA
jgi:nicotinamidase/pyrazinamidase